MIEQLTNVWKNYGTKQIAKIFESYMIGLGVKKYDARCGNKTNTYENYNFKEALKKCNPYNNHGFCKFCGSIWQIENTDDCEYIILTKED